MSQHRKIVENVGAVRIMEGGYLQVKPSCKINMGDNVVGNVADPVTDRDSVNLEFLYKFIWVGDLKYSAHSIDMGCWLICDGRSLSVSVYPVLYSIIGTKFGTAGAGFFNLPDARGTTLAASGNHPGLTSRLAGQTTGAETYTLTSNELPSHTHGYSMSSDGTHNHGGSTGSSGAASTGSTSLVAISGGGSTVCGDGTHNHTISNDGLHSHTLTINNTGSGNPFNIFQPTLFIGNLFILAFDPNIIS